MADSKTDPTDDTTEEQSGTAEETVEGQENEQTEESNDSDDEEEETSPEAELPEWVQKELTKTRQEAARYRTSLRDAERRLTEAKTQEDIDAAVAEVRETAEKIETDLLVERALRTHKLSDEDVEFFDGLTDADAIEARAQKLAARSSRTDEDDIDDLRGGLDPSRRRNDRDSTPEYVNSVLPRGRNY